MAHTHIHEHARGIIVRCCQKGKSLKRRHFCNASVSEVRAVIRSRTSTIAGHFLCVVWRKAISRKRASSGDFERPTHAPRSLVGAQACAQCTRGLPACPGAKSTRKDPWPKEKHVNARKKCTSCMQILPVHHCTLLVQFIIPYPATNCPQHTPYTGRNYPTRHYTLSYIPGTPQQWATQG